MSFLSTLYEVRKIKSALIVMPVTLISNWDMEFQKWAPGMPIEEFHGTSKVQRTKACERVQRSGGTLLTTYGLLQSCSETLSVYRGRQFVWDYIILDEGHKIKNPTKTTTAANSLPSRNRIILTGTPIQNNLSELWSLFDFVHQGSLLGTAKTFKSEFEHPIVRSRQRDASGHEKHLGQEVSNLLAKRIRPYFLRRTKEEVLNCSQSDMTGEKKPKRLSQKNDFVVWVHLSKDQIRLYEDFLKLDQVKEILMTNRSPLVQLTVLKKICDHPRLLSANACEALGLDNEENQDRSSPGRLGVNYSHVSDEQLMNESGKMKFLINLLSNLKSEGHRCLVFSQFRMILDVIQRLLKNRNFKVLRIDGTVSLPSERHHLIRKFEKDESYSVFLLTTQVGGVGLTLTAADRVIIYDPSWNPATDSQAVDRVYRIGQTKAVVVYRLITCSTVEEKIYRRQVFKHSIHQQTVENKANPTRYFSKQELVDMFQLEDPTTSKTQLQLERMHAAQRKTNTDLDAHIAFLYSLDIFGISDHDLLFTSVTEAADVVDAAQKEHIGAWLNRANKLVEMECEMSDKARIEQGGFVKAVLPEDVLKTSTGGARLVIPKNASHLRPPPAGARKPLSQIAVNSDDDMDTLASVRKPLSQIVVNSDEEMDTLVSTLKQLSPSKGFGKQPNSGITSPKEMQRCSFEEPVYGSPWRPSNRPGKSSLQTLPDIGNSKKQLSFSITQNKVQDLSVDGGGQTEDFEMLSPSKDVVVSGNIRRHSPRFTEEAAKYDKTDGCKVGQPIVVEDSVVGMEEEISKSHSCSDPDSYTASRNSRHQRSEDVSIVMVEESVLDGSVLDSDDNHRRPRRGPLNSTTISNSPSIVGSSLLPSDSSRKSWEAIGDISKVSSVSEEASGSHGAGQPAEEQWLAAIPEFHPSQSADLRKASRLRRSSMVATLLTDVERMHEATCEDGLGQSEQSQSSSNSSSAEESSDSSEEEIMGKQHRHKSVVSSESSDSSEEEIMVKQRRHKAVVSSDESE